MLQFKLNDPFAELALESLDPDPVPVTTNSLRIVNGEIVERVTDSAASATAIATGFKTRNGGMSVDLDCATIRCCDAETETCAGELRTALEAAEAMGKATGIVSNVNVQDATPGVWAAHWHTRSGRPIASQQVNAGLEVHTMQPKRRSSRWRRRFRISKY